MMSHTAPTSTTEHQAKTSASVEVNNTGYVPNYNDTDYSDFLYLAPPLSTEFLPLEPAADKAARPMIKKSKVRPSETFNTGTTPPPTTPMEKPYAKATFPATMSRSSTSDDDMAKAAERRERRPSFVEVTPVKVHHEHEKHQDAHGHHHHDAHRRRSSHESEPMGWWPEDDTKAQHEWVEQNEEEDVIEEDVWSDAFYE
ncbi:uncharacterized protein PV07_03647 [Cladophialophora immunda]|uniref:Uncharacterized protein n=2 Tax=Eurotiomycetes TaxID=147545 RepID=A0A0D2CLL3_9EURO|nr:uncharacterized protein PV07_03647 [Cladophialophora immunda]KIW32073.1 hypothetical protein PV07_03647 [Cladophialophora immunda]OQU96780.1 hypothetical protein CLAIMM_02812 [Cladophialophora immunda]